MDSYVMIVLPLLIGWGLDMAFGDPARLPHPVVWFGRAIGWCERHLNRGPHRGLWGGVTAVGLIVGVWLATRCVLRLAAPWRWVEILLQGVLIFYCLAGKTLTREVREVFAAVDRSLDEGRRQVGRIVGRDTAALSGREIRTAALETLAENLSDGVVAPLFWYALAGVPGMMAYKMVNTLDSMIGYRNERYRQFGRVAARIDDAANYIPARLTAWLMVMVAGQPRLAGFVRRFGRCHASPNSGYPEAALAGILECRFGGPHDYFGECVVKPYIGVNERDFTYADVVRAIAVNRRVEVCAVILAAGVRVLFAL